MCQPLVPRNSMMFLLLNSQSQQAMGREERQSALGPVWKIDLHGGNLSRALTFTMKRYVRVTLASQSFTIVTYALKIDRNAWCGCSTQYHVMYLDPRGQVRRALTFTIIGYIFNTDCSLRHGGGNAPANQACHPRVQVSARPCPFLLLLTCTDASYTAMREAQHKDPGIPSTAAS